MSRIYDALQRADIERQAAQGRTPQKSRAVLCLRLEDLPPTRLASTLRTRSAIHGSHPLVLPSGHFGDRGEGIEQFRGLRSANLPVRDQNPLKTILVSSGMPARAKTFVAANLAVSLARNRNNTVLLIDADLRRPALHAILGAPSAPGLAEYLAGAAEVSDILQRNENPRVVEAGINARHPGSRLYSLRRGWRQLFGARRQSSYRRAGSRPFTALLTGY